jgi:O-antigen ligase
MVNLIRINIYPTDNIGFLNLLGFLLIPILLALALTLLSIKVVISAAAIVLMLLILNLAKLELIPFFVIATSFLLQFFYILDIAYSIITNALFAIIIIHYYIKKSLQTNQRHYFSEEHIVAGCFLLFALIANISMIYNETYNFDATLETIRYYSLIPLFIILFDYIKTKITVIKMLHIIVGISFFTALYSYYLAATLGVKAFVFSGISVLHGLQAGLGNANSLAFLIGLAIPILLSYVLYVKNQRNKGITITILSFMFAIWFLCNSRSSYIFMVFAFLVIILFHKKRIVYLLRTSIILTGSVVVIFLSPVLKQLMRLESGLSNRDALWKAAIKMFHNNPLWGNGPLSFNTSVFYEVDPGFAKEISAHIFGGAAHNLILTKAAETGIFGVLAIILLWGYVLWLFIKNRNLMKHSELQYLYIASGAIFIGIIFRSIFEIGYMIGNGRLNENILPMIIITFIIKLPALNDRTVSS